MTKSITGEVEAGEARNANAAIARRQRGSTANYYVRQLIMVAAGGIAGFGIGWVVDAFVTHHRGPEPILMMVVGVVIGSVTFSFTVRRFTVQRFRKQMSDRAMELRFRQTLTLNQETIELTSGAIHAVAPWSAVTEVFGTKSYWIFMVGMNAWHVPKRFFTDKAAERDFIRTALAHLDDGPRDRSKDAVTFAGR